MAIGQKTGRLIGWVALAVGLTSGAAWLIHAGYQNEAPAIPPRIAQQNQPQEQSLEGLPEGNAASGLSGHRLEFVPKRQNPELGPWSPILLVHLKHGVFEGYPAYHQADGLGEFTLYAWRRFNLLGYYWVDNRGDPRAIVVALDLAREPSEQLRGVLMADPSGCDWVPSRYIRLVRDRYGLHPLVAVQDQRPDAGLGDLEASLSVAGVLDWTQVPEQGLGYRRNWPHQEHLPHGVPSSDGVVLRFELAGGYAQGRRSGRGNTPHHWNLLSYRIAPIEDFLKSSGSGARDNPDQWACAGLIEQTAAVIDAAMMRQETRIPSKLPPRQGTQ